MKPLKCSDNSCSKLNTITSHTATVGSYISLFGVVLILVWIGICKFAPFEAVAIKPYVENHFLLSWMYDVFTVQQVSNFFGIAELVTATFLLLGLKFDFLRRVGALFLIATFITTLSFIFTTPGVFKVIDGILVTDFFVLKDLPMLGLGFAYLHSYKI